MLKFLFDRTLGRLGPQGWIRLRNRLARAAAFGDRWGAKLLVLAAVAALGFGIWSSPIVPIYRSAAFALYAHAQAGPNLPVDHIDYARSAWFDPNLTWGVQTNSQYLIDRLELIVPYFSYEGVSPIGRYPNMLIWSPNRDYRSHHVAGSAAVAQGILALNSRMLLDPRWQDERMVLATLTHELVHFQGGNYLVWGDSVTTESHTTAATTEVLAAMCHYMDPVACRAFWAEVKDLALNDLQVRLHALGLDPLYQSFADLFIRDGRQEMRADKAMRFWMSGHEDELWGILERYGQTPFLLMAEGTCPGATLDTGTTVWTFPARGRPYGVVLGMPWDDTKALFGPFWNLILCGTWGR